MTANDIRNIALLGHGGSGKTSLAEQMLFMTKGTDRLGRTADGNTTCDYDAEEIKRQISISLAFAPVNYKGVKINVMDAPGNFDFSGEALSAIRAAECAVLVGAAKDGLSVGMERSWKMLGKKPRMIFINRTDEDNSDYASCLDALKGKFGQAIAPIVAPVIDGNKKVTAIVDLLHNTAYEVKGGKAAACAIPADMADEVEALRAELMEAAAGADEELMEKFGDNCQKVIKLSRLRYAKDSFDKGPIVLTTSYLPEGDSFLFDYDFTNASLTTALNEQQKNRYSMEKDLTALVLG